MQINHKNSIVCGLLVFLMDLEEGLLTLAQEKMKAIRFVSIVIATDIESIFHPPWFDALIF